MPPGRLSRYKFALGYTNTDGIVFLGDRVPFRYRTIADTATHVVGSADTLWSLAGRYYAGFESVVAPAAGLWWVIADFQPVPIIDPTIRLSPGTTMYIPSESTIVTEIFNDALREEA